MPSSHGIEVSVSAQSVAGQLPEYPHPDGSAALGLDDTPGGDRSGVHPSDGIEHDETPREKRTNNPVVSVYIPSAPGSQFWINYVVRQEPSPPCHLFFKLYMNGRHITSWGINPRIKRAGRAEKALYEPSERWDQEENGVVFKQEGIEARYFHFVGGQPPKSVADDGGVIEVRVFRAKGRKRRAATLDQYRQQEKYGITAPSGGLLDNPQDVTFFDFHLIDPKDTPFATFRFHYRSRENLLQLSLIPSEAPPHGLPATSTNGSGTSKHSHGSPRRRGSTTPTQVPSTSVCPNPDASVFDDSGSSSGGVDGYSASGGRKPRRNSSYILRTPPQLRPRSATSHNLPQPSKSFRDGVAITGSSQGPGSINLQRPLPDRPLPELPALAPDDDTSWLGPSRKSSNASATPSVAPSLMSYVKNESYLNETVEYGQARAVPMDKDHPGVPAVLPEKARLIKRGAGGKSTPGSDYCDAYHHRSATSNSPPYQDQGTAPSSRDEPYSLASMACGNTVAREQDDRSPTLQNATTRSRDLALDLARFPHLKLSESDWKPRTPSPQLAPRRMLSPGLGRLWSTLRRNKSRSPLRDVHHELAPRNHSTPQLAGPEVKERHGNWI